MAARCRAWKHAAVRRPSPEAVITSGFSRPGHRPRPPRSAGGLAPALTGRPGSGHAGCPAPPGHRPYSLAGGRREEGEPRRRMCMDGRPRLVAAKINGTYRHEKQKLAIRATEQSVHVQDSAGRGAQWHYACSSGADAWGHIRVIEDSLTTVQAPRTLLYARISSSPPEGGFDRAGRWAPDVRGRPRPWNHRVGHLVRRYGSRASACPGESRAPAQALATGSVEEAESIGQSAPGRWRLARAQARAKTSGWTHCTRPRPPGPRATAR